MDLGDLARDSITGFEGVVIGITDWLYNCERVVIQPQKLKDGKVIGDESFDIGQCLLRRKGVVVGTVQTAKVFKNGATVKDTITGFVGTVIGQTRWLHAPTSIIVQPVGLEKGEIKKALSFEVGRLALVKDVKVERPKPEDGGPMPTPRRF